MPSKRKDKRKAKPKGKDDKKVIKTDDSVVDRAKANASLWEARLEVTELSRIEYRDTSRKLAKYNEELKKQQYKMEKDTMSVLSYLKKQDQEKDNMIEKLKQQLAETKEKAQEEKERLEQKYTIQINELEGRFHQKSKEIGMIQTELKTIKQFQKRKIQVERELDDVKENLRNTEKKHQETLRRLEGKFFEEKEINELLIKEKIMQLTQQKSQIQTLQKKVVSLENALSYMTKEFEAEVSKLQQQAMIENQAGQVEIDKLQQLLQMKDREMNRVKKLAKNILDERTEMESFFLDALHQVKQQIIVSRRHYKQIAQAAFNLKMRTACAGRTEYPKIRTFDGREHSTNSMNQDLIEAEKWTSTQRNVDIGDLTWEQKEKVLRLLFAKMNGFASRDESTLQNQTFITQQVPVSDSGEMVLPSIPQGQDSDIVRSL
ncbi:basal body-orientation factor 1 isoform X4 [Castor canadensis]|uniref:Basal body-orientation factor 1 isoform X4 n=1 Tax=Castor canadensis TaxID=51338 RepID=A0AC58M2M8_CASCN